MRKILLLSIAVVFNFLFLEAQVPSGYYDAATGTGYTLKTQLHDIIDGHSSQSYDALWTHFQTLEVDNYYEDDGSPLDVYSENPTGADPYNWTFVSDQCGNYSGEGSCYNREHSFPKSWFNDGSPMYTDLFHLYLTDGYVNGQRGSFPFGEVGTADWTSLNGSKKGTCSYPGYSGTVFEPIDEFKGDFARTYFYMATRYEDVISGWPGSAMLDGSSDQVFTDWALNMLLEWHENDPVSQKEIDRNDGVYDIQNNRNPFIDHPEWVDEIWGGGTIDPEPDNHLTNFLATAAGSSQIDLSWTDATGTNLPDGYLILANDDNSFTAPSDGTDPAEDADLSDGSAVVKVSHGIESYSFTGLNAETTYYFKVWSYANSGSDIDFKLDGTVPSGDATTEVAAASNSIAIQDFDGTTPTWSYTGDGDVGTSYGKTDNGYRIGGSDIITFSAVDVSDYSSMTIFIADASAGGVENADALEVYVNLDGGGYPATPDVTIQEGDPDDTNYNVSWDYSASGTASTTAGTPVTVNGDGASGYANIEITIPDGTSTVELKIASNNNNSDEYYYLDDIKIEGESAGATPTLTVSPITLSGFTYEESNGPSASQSFTLSGSDLDGTEVTITAPAYYEISLDNSTFSDSETIAYTAPRLDNTTVYVRLKAGLSAGTYNNENVTLADDGSANSVTVANSGEVTAALNPVPDNYPTDFMAVPNGSSQIDVSWTDATGDNLPDGYLLKAGISETFAEPVNGIQPNEDNDLSDGEAALIVNYGTTAHSFTGLTESSTYYFKIWPYSNSGDDILYKLDGDAPETLAETEGTGITDKSTASAHALIFPNPAKNELNIQLKGRYFIRVFSIRGQLKYEKHFLNKTTIDVHEFNRGIYLIHIQGAGVSGHEMIVIE